MTNFLSFKWLKVFLPRSLYGRAALILVLPIITLQLAISIAFIQRHFDGVTSQMTRSVALDLQFLLDGINGADDLPAALGVVASIAEPLASTWVSVRRSFGIQI